MPKFVDLVPKNVLIDRDDLAETDHILDCLNLI